MNISIIHLLIFRSRHWKFTLGDTAIATSLLTCQLQSPRHPTHLRTHLFPPVHLKLPISYPPTHAKSLIVTVQFSISARWILSDLSWKLNHDVFLSAFDLFPWVQCLPDSSHGIPLCKCSTDSLSKHQLMGTQVDSLPWAMWTWKCRCPLA